MSDMLTIDNFMADIANVKAELDSLKDVAVGDS
jgi:hypothetical protein